MNVCRLILSAAVVLFGSAALLSLQVSGQAQPPVSAPPPPAALAPQESGQNTTLFEANSDGTITIVERNASGQTLRTTRAQPSGAQTVQYSPANTPNTFSPFIPVQTADGRTVYSYSHSNSPFAQDGESQKLYAQEQAAAREVRALAEQAQKASSDGEKADAKKKLRETLAQIFDVQQQRRAHEIAKIEERLGKLKDTLKKRETAKDSIVDRRAETLTGGVDELGWEDTFGAHATPYGPRAANSLYLDPPRYAPPGYGAPGTTPAPPVSPVPPALPAAPAPPAPTLSPRAAR